ncbi:NAD(P)-dependent oxidoreductase [Robertmurraya massiliosenegalensis]|uniref:NAD(P)-dependent oxidoreductase n=1 Tax=Robertmurraya TaxID=2837507 RepID=UPI0039A48934
MKAIILDDWEYFFEDNSIIAPLREHFDVEIYHDEPTKEVLIERLASADIVIPIRERTKFTKEILQHMKNVKLIAQTGGGLAHIDKGEANRLCIPIATTPGGSRAVVELIFGFILTHSRQLISLNQEIRNGNWPHAVGSSLDGKTIGIIGLGKIGAGVAQVAKAFNMRVIAWGPRLTKERADEQDVEYVSLESLLKEAHYISISVRLVPETIHLLKKEHFQLMREDAFFINTSRGKVVDEEALIWALHEKQIGGAGLDVFTQEPIQPDNLILQLENVVLAPHIGWKTDQMLTQFLTTAIDNVISYFVRKEPKRIINEEVIK